MLASLITATAAVLGVLLVAFVVEVAWLRIQLWLRERRWRMRWK